MTKLDTSALPSLQFWGLLIAFAGLFLMGGSSRDDAQSLALLNPLMILCCGAALLSFKHEHWRYNKWLLACLAVTFLLVSIYILPLPSLLRQSLKVGAEGAEVRAVSKVLGTRQFPALFLGGAWQSLFFLFAPLAVLLFAVQLDRAELQRTFPLLIAAGAISGVLGVLQLAGSASGTLYLYDITNNGGAVGLFANRNHAAVFLACLFPMLAVFANTRRLASQSGTSTAQLFAIALAILLIPLILVTGSRSGMLTAIIGLIGGVALYVSRAPQRGGPKAAKFAVPVLAAAVMACLVFITIYFSRAEAIDRLFADSGVVTERADFWSTGVQLFWHYFPWGFGPGAFVPAFQQVEPVALLGGAYLNRLHNDWLETALTLGVPGILLMLGAVGYYVIHSFQLWARMDGSRPSVTVGRMASIIIAILAVASFSDYPLRTPALMGFAALALLWFVGARSETSLVTQPVRSAGS